MTAPRSLTFSSHRPRGTVDLLVVGVEKDDDALRVVGDALPADLVAGLDLTLLGASASTETVVRVPGTGTRASVVALVGVGEAGRDRDGDARRETLRRAAGSAARASDAGHVAFALPVEDVADAVAVAEGGLLGAYRYDRTAPSRPRTEKVEVIVPDAIVRAAEKTASRTLVVTGAVCQVRDLVNDSPNDLYPESFAEIAKKVAKVPGVKVTVLDEKALAAGGYGGLLGVGQGSVRPPRLVKVAYAPAKAKVHVGLVGKGITFDSGGLSIKTAKGMEAMKSDMAGAATVLHTVVAAARLKLPVAVSGWLCLAENMPSGTATRPSDVLTIRGGTTVEVLNTDAEGRLVLADGLVSAREDGVDLVVDIATLTGAQMVALGDRVAAAMGTKELRSRTVDAARTVGEQLWPMPLPVELRASLDSKVADLANIGDRFGGMLVAGLFLKEFVGDTPWVHLDVAGPAFNERAAHDYTPPGGTGFGLRTLLGLLEDAAKG